MNFLDTLYPCDIYHNLRHYVTLEHALQASRAPNWSWHDRIRSFPIEAFEDTFINNRSEFAPYKMIEVFLALKFAPGSLLASLLLDTPDEELDQFHKWRKTELKLAYRDCVAMDIAYYADKKSQVAVYKQALIYLKNIYDPDKQAFELACMVEFAYKPRVYAQALKHLGNKP